MKSALAAVVAVSMALAPVAYAAPKSGSKAKAAATTKGKKKPATAKKPTAKVSKALAKAKAKPAKVPAAIASRPPATRSPTSLAATAAPAAAGASGGGEPLPGAQTASSSQSNMDALFGGTPAGSTPAADKKTPPKAAPKVAVTKAEAKPQVEGAQAGEKSEARDTEQNAEADHETDPASGPSELAAVDIQAGSKFFSRSLQYTDDVFGALRGYKLGGAPALALQLEWYPGAHWSNDWKSLVGLTASYDRSIGVVSKISNDLVTYPTTSQSWSVGVRGRYQMGRFQPHVSLGYGNHGFEIASVSATYKKPEIPNLDYSFLRAGVGTRVTLPARFSVNLSAGYLKLLKTGEIASAKYFPRSTAAGVEGNLTVGYRLASNFEIRAGADMRRYFFSMNPKIGDPVVAGGAIDQYLGGTLGVAFQR